MKNCDGWQSLSVLICLLSQSWRQLLVCECFPEGPYRLKSNREGGKLGTCFDFVLQNICVSGWLEMTSDLLKHLSSLGTDKYFGGFYPIVAAEGRECEPLLVSWMLRLTSLT